MAPQMDDANRAMCYALRNPGRGKKKTKYADIRKVVRNKNGGRPTIGAIQQAAVAWKAVKKVRGRKKGQLATTKEDIKVLMAKFHKLRPKGHGIDANTLRRALPVNVKKKIGPRTVIRRLADKGYTSQ